MATERGPSKRRCANSGTYVYPAAGWTFRKRFYFWATASQLEPIRRHIDNIVTYDQHPVTNAIREELNSQIQEIKHMACGFRNIENFKTTSYFRCGAVLSVPC